jgi:hypothetical protein
MKGYEIYQTRTCFASFINSQPSTATNYSELVLKPHMATEWKKKKKNRGKGV